MQISDSQLQEYVNLLNKDIPNIMEENCVKDGNIEITFSPIRIPYNGLRETAYDFKDTIRCLMTVRNVLTKEQVITSLALAEIPAYSQVGYRIKGSSYSLIKSFRRATGWYIIPKRNAGISETIMELITYRSCKLEFSSKNSIVSVSVSGKNKNKKVNVFSFIKALTGMSFSAIATQFGLSNKIVSYNLGELLNSDIGEPNREACMKATLKLFVTGNTNIDIMSANDLKSILTEYVLGGKKIKFDNSASCRLAESVSFSSRARGSVLVKPIDINGKHLVSDTVLTTELLNEIDETDIKELNIRVSGSNYQLKKFSSSGEFSIDNLMTMVNTYMCVLDGLDVNDSRYEMDNRIAFQYSDLVGEYLDGVLSSFVDHITGELNNNGDMSEVVSSLTLPKLDSFMTKYMSNFKEQQTKDQTNILAGISQGRKITSDVNSSSVSDDMLKVQDLQAFIIDAHDSPESAKVGIAQILTCMTITDDNGFLCCPFIELKNGKIVSETPMYLNAREFKDKNIGMWNADLNADMIDTLCNGTAKRVPVKDVSYLIYSPLCLVSPSSGLVTFINHSNGKRIVMAAGQNKQSTPTVVVERPIVSTGTGSVMGIGILRAEDILKQAYMEMSNELDGVITIEDFVKQEIKLIGTDYVSTYRKLLFTTVVNGDVIHIVHLIPYAVRTIKDTMNTWMVNPKGSKGRCHYSPKDIVAHDNGVSISEERALLLDGADFGFLPLDEHSFDSDVALGNNIIIGYKTWESANIDDGMVMSEELLCNGKTDTVKVIQVEVELKDMLDKEERLGFISNAKTNPNINQDGLPKIGSYFAPHSVIIAKYEIQKDNESSDSVGKIKDTSKRLSKLEEGEVVNVHKHGNKIIIHLAQVLNVKVGDKMTGRHGNKGVISRFVPKEDMPYDPVTGTRLQMLLNPAGLPSRMNISQLIEGVLSFILRKQNKAIIVAPYKEGAMELIETYKAFPTDGGPMRLRDGRTGEYFKRPVQVTSLYLQKLEHTIDSKAHSIGFAESLDKVTLQPKKGKKSGGGQSIGEMETWCLQAVGATNLLTEVMSISSDATQDRESLELYSRGLLKEDDLEYNNNNDKFLQILMRSLGVEVVNAGDTAINIVPLTDERTKALAPRPLDLGNKQCLHDPAIFGGIKTTRQLQESIERWGYIELNTEIVAPFFLTQSALPKLLVVEETSTNSKGELVFKKANLTHSKVKDLVMDLSSQSFLTFDHGVARFVNKKYARKYKEQYPLDTACRGIESIVQLLRVSNMQESRLYISECLAKHTEKLQEKVNYKMDSSKTAQEVREYRNLLDAINNLEDSGIEFTDYIVTTFPIAPQRMRIELEDGRRKPDWDYYYRDIIQASIKSKDLCSRDNTYAVYRAVLQFTGLDSNVCLPKEKDCKNLLHDFVGKNPYGSGKCDGRIRDNIVSKRVQNSGRSVITPASKAKLDIRQVEIPLDMMIDISEYVLETYLEREFKNSLGPSRDFKAILDAMSIKDVKRFRSLLSLETAEFDEVSRVYDTIFDKIVEFAKGEVVLVGRQPSLHRYSIRAFIPVPVERRVIGIHPLVCSGYNADFDGDMMWVYRCQTDTTRREALALLSPEADLINPKDDSFVLTPSQDVLMGLYLATGLYDNEVSIYNNNDLNLDLRERYVDIIAYSDYREIETDVKSGNIDMQQLTCLYHSNGRRYISTAGRMVVNGKLIGGFTEEPFKNVLHIPNLKESCYSDLLYDGLIKKKEENKYGIKEVCISDILIQQLRDHGPKLTLDVLQDIYELGLWASDTDAVSYTLDDVEEHKDRQELEDKCRKIADKYKQFEEDGLVTHEESVDILTRIYKKAKDTLQSKMLKSLGRNNNMFIMADSGARGNISNVMQTCGMIGIVSKSASESLEDPVFSNYVKGLSIAESIAISYGTRQGVASTQHGVRDAGYGTRKAVYMNVSVKIEEVDCGQEGQDIPLDYNDPIDKVDSLVLGKRLDIEQDCYKYVEEMSDDDILTEDMLGVLYKHKVRTIKLDNDFIEVKLPVGKDVIGLKFAETDIETEASVSNTLIDGRITELTLPRLKELNVNNIYVLQDFVNIKYELSAMNKSLLSKRLLTDKELLEKYGDILIHGKYISDKFIKVVESLNMETINVRLLTGCLCTSGVCAKCYGLDNTSLKLNKVGTNVGITASQAIGESSAQLKMNVINMGGVAGTGMSGASEMYNALLNGKLPSKDFKAKVASNDGVVEVRPLGAKEVMVYGVGEPLRLDKRLLVVKDGETVDKNDRLTLGLIKPEDLEPGVYTSSAVLRRQLLFIKYYFDAFAGSNINVNAIHFEVFTRSQFGIVTVAESNDDSIIVGKVYARAELADKIDNGDVKVTQSIATRDEVMEFFGDSLTSAMFESYWKKIGKVAVGGGDLRISTDLSKMLSGQDLRGNTIKEFTTPKHRNVSTQETVQENIVAPIHLNTVDEMDLFADTPVSMEIPGATSFDDLDNMAGLTFDDDFLAQLGIASEDVGAQTLDIMDIMGYDEISAVEPKQVPTEVDDSASGIVVEKLKGFGEG